MKHVIYKVLLASGVMALSTSALAVPVTLVADTLRSASSGGFTNMIFTGSSGTNCTHNTSPVGGPSANGGTACNFAPSNATWDWNAGTGVLTQTGGTLTSARWSGSNPAGGQLLYADIVTGLVLTTTTGTTPGGSTAATSYTCYEGNFGEGTGASSCGNYTVGVNGFDESPRLYTFGGDAACVVINQSGDDGAYSFANDGITPDGGPRGLMEPGSFSDPSCVLTLGARDMVHVQSNTLNVGGTLVLWNTITNDTTGVSTACSVTGTQANCKGAHTMTFANAPVPAAVWLFGSALGLLGWVRRRALA